MKFIHIADVHLGAVPDSTMPWGDDRKNEIWISFQGIIDICNQECIDLLLIAGDLFHRQPFVRELKEVNYYFSKLQVTQVVLIAGNHDYISPRSNYTGFEWDKRVHMLISDTLDSVYLAEINTEVFGFSYHNRDITEPLYDTVKPQSKDRIQILLAHGGDEKDIPINKKRLQEAGFHYVALGHIHKPEIISERMAYAGSLEPLDKNEIGERGYILGDITIENDHDYPVRISFVANSRRQYKRLRLTVDQETTNGELQDQARELIRTHGVQHLYQFVIQGFRDASISFEKEAISKLGNVTEVIDQSVPDYNFDELYSENADNIIGLFIQAIRTKAGEDDITKKALYYGIEALLGARDK